MLCPYLATCIRRHVKGRVYNIAIFIISNVYVTSICVDIRLCGRDNDKVSHSNKLQITGDRLNVLVIYVIHVFNARGGGKKSK